MTSFKKIIYNIIKFPLILIFIKTPLIIIFKKRFKLGFDKNKRNIIWATLETLFQGAFCYPVPQNNRAYLINRS